MAMNREKGGRHDQFLDKQGNDLLMICKDCTKAAKKNAFTSAILFISHCQELITHWSKIGLSIL